ncbi:hypothetical protein A2U01_0116676, partial [Trifolium medium]|nr:hypothetical protein [Trifolium medium]
MPSSDVGPDVVTLGTTSRYP